MNFDAINIALFVLATILGVTYFSIRNARKQKERKLHARKRSF